MNISSVSFNQILSVFFFLSFVTLQHYLLCFSFPLIYSVFLYHLPFPFLLPPPPPHTYSHTPTSPFQMKESQLGISVKMEMGWMDPRLTFTNMASKTRLDEALDLIWKPTIVFVGAKYEDNVNLQQGVNIMRFLFAESSTMGVPAVVNSSKGEALHRRTRTWGACGRSVCRYTRCFLRRSVVLSHL